MIVVNTIDSFSSFFFNDTATTEIYTLSLHDALPICQAAKDEFVRSVGSGFAETEGVHIEIVNRGTDQTIRMTYGVKDPHNGDRKETIDIGADVLKKIIEDREKFDMQVGA